MRQITCRPVTDLIAWMLFGLLSTANVLAKTPVKQDCKTVRGEVIYFGPAEATALLGVKHGLRGEDKSGCQQQVALNLRTVTETEILSFNKPKPAAIFVAADAETIRLLSMMNSDIPIFNLTEEYDDLRALCLSNLLHISPSNKMKEDAVRDWHKQPVAGEATAYAWVSDDPNRWATGLNEAFQRTQGKAMDESAWAGWIAVNVLAQSIAKLKNGKSEALLTYLRHELRFDPGTGVSLSFRPNGQLRQSLQMTVEDKWIGTVPSSAQPTDADLDRLGPGYCPKLPQSGQPKASAQR